MTENKPYHDAIELLKKLVATPSFSTSEENTAAVIETFFQSKDIPFNRHLNNIWCMNKYFDTARPTLLLNSHHDTVKPNTQYSIDPFSPIQKDEKLFGLGSNDAGGCLVALITAFCHFYEMRDLKYNLIIAATAEEEISGKNGIESILSLLPKIDVAIVGEPTQTNLAIAEKGLLVLDCISTGKAGHAAREEGENAIYKAMQDISWFQSYRFSKISESLGPVKMSVTS
ncbi:MAG: M20/M25/M40 family metallo-hydrolase, partial [Ferruginibacter sp.]